MKAPFTIRLALTVMAVMLAWPRTAVLALSTVCTGTSQVFNYSGVAQSFTVPAAVTQVTIDAAGVAGGGSGGGKGAELAASFAVTPGETLNIVVGGAGGGGLGGGGGGSFVYTSPTAVGLLIAAAGGGGGVDCFYTPLCPVDGNAGNAAGDGLGGIGGTGGNGGDNDGDPFSSGGGGGGLLSDGASSPQAGGGGSYSAATPIFAQSGAQSGNGQVSFCFTPFAGTPGFSNCHGQSVSALAQQFGGLNAAATALGFSSAKALQDAIKAFCRN